MEVCRNWGSEGCHPDIDKWKFAEIEEDKVIIHPEREELDKICKNCKALSFKECPSCNGKDILVSTRIEFKEKEKKIEHISFACKDCEAFFTITRTIDL